MKTIKMAVGKRYEFKCSRCRSVFSMTAEERMENDMKYNESKNIKCHNPLNKFDCPVCGTQRYMESNSIHCYIVYSDGTDYLDY